MTFVCTEWRRQVILFRFFFFIHFGRRGFRESGFRASCRRIILFVISCVFFCVGLYGNTVQTTSVAIASKLPLYGNTVQTVVVIKRVEVVQSLVSLYGNSVQTERLCQRNPVHTVMNATVRALLLRYQAELLQDLPALPNLPVAQGALLTPLCVGLVHDPPVLHLRVARVHPVAKMLQHIYVWPVSEGAPECDCQLGKEPYLHDGSAGGPLRLEVLNCTVPLEAIGC